jgi:transcriptional regulator with XRE-family HTH domain
VRKTEPFYTELGKLVARVRKCQGWSQAKLAARLGLTSRSIGNIERGEQRVLGHQLMRLCYLLDLNPADLLEMERDSAAAPSKHPEVKS